MAKLIVFLGLLTDVFVLRTFESGRTMLFERRASGQINVVSSVLETKEKGKKISQEAMQLLEVIDDTTVDLKVRADATRKLGVLRELATVDRLLRHLPGDDDVLTIAIVVALGSIGDVKALPVLEKMLEEGDNYTGKLRGAIIDSIKILKKRK